METENRKLCAALGLIYLNRILPFLTCHFVVNKKRDLLCFPELLKKISRRCVLRPSFCGVLLVQRITARVIDCSLLLRNRIFYYCNECSSPFFFVFFGIIFLEGRMLWIFKRHFNPKYTISDGRINNPCKPTAFLRNLQHEPIVDFRLIHPAIGRKNCDSGAFLSTISSFLQCWRKRNRVLIHVFSLAWMKKQKDISLRLAQFPFDS